VDRRLVGMDLGIASAHTVRVLAEDGREVCRRRCEPTVADFARVEAAALHGAAAGTRLEVVIEPTGPAWLPVAVFFTGRGHSVYRVSSAKASDLRKFFSRHAKSNGIDADTLARLPLVAPAGPLELPGPEAAALDRRVRAADRLTRVAAEHKVRIKDLVHQLMPLTPLTGDLGAADLAVLERYADPRALLKAGPARLSTLIDKASHGHQGAERATAWRASATAAVELYAAYPAMPFSDLADEVVSEVRLLRATQTEIARHGEAREQAYRPVLVAVMGRAARFPTAGHFRSYTGLTPRASETGNTDRKGQPMSKAGSSLLRTTLARAADTARKQDPQLAKIYYTQMVDRGADHIKALCVVAAALAERAWAVLRRGMPYVICDTDATPVTPEQAKKIIAEQWTVTAEVRARRRSTKNHQQDPQRGGGEGPSTSPRRTRAVRRAKRRQTRRPSPRTILVTTLPKRQANHLLTPDPP